MAVSQAAELVWKPSDRFVCVSSGKIAVNKEAFV